MGACATEKEVSRTPTPKPPEEFPMAEEKKAPAPTEPEDADDAGAGKGKSGKRQSAKAKRASAGEDGEYDDAGAGKGKGGKRPSAKEKRAYADDEDDEYDDDADNSGVLDNSNVFFQYASYELSSAARKELERVAAILKRNKNARATLTGHTCDKSSSLVNMRLSQNRANAASSYLQQLGISARRISVGAHGYSDPLVPNTTEQNRAKNRRVEITVENN